MSTPISPTAFHKSATLVDLHIHPSMSQQIFRRDVTRATVKWDFELEPVRASFPAMKAGGYDVFCSVLHLPERGLLEDFWVVWVLRYLRWQTWNKLMERPAHVAINGVIDEIEKAATASHHKSSVRVARSVSELQTILALPHDERPVALVHAVEGAHALGDLHTSTADALAHLQTLFDRGVAYLTLAHFYENLVVHPCYPFPDTFTELSKFLKGQDESDIWRDLTLGLNPTGVKVVEWMMDKSMLIDLSHCTPMARRQVYDMAKAHGAKIPLLMTHVGAYTINPTPYNPADWEIELIAEMGGVIGVIFMNYWLMPASTCQSINAISQTIRHLISVGGENCVGIGTDFDGFTSPPDDLHNASKMPRLTERLIAEGYTDEQVKKILGGNALQVLLNGWGRKN